MYHPDTGHEAEVMNDEQAAIYAESGWLPAPEPEEPEPGHAPEPVRYAPVESKPAAKRTSKTAKESSD